MDGVVEQVSDMIIPKKGEHGFYFVKSLTEHFIHPLTGWAQGHLLIVKDMQGMQRVYSTAGRAIQAIQPGLIAKKQVVGDCSPEVALGVVAVDSKTPGLALDVAKQQLQNLISH